MSNKDRDRRRATLFLVVSAHIGWKGFRFRLPLPPIALFSLHAALFSLVPLCCLVPATPGKYLRAGIDSLDALLLGFMGDGLDEFANIEIRNKSNEVKVRVRMF